MVQGHQLAGYYGEQSKALTDLIYSHRRFVAHALQRDAELVEQLKAARRELAAVYLPDLTPKSVERVAQLTGFQGFQRRDLRAAIEHERKVLQSALAKAEADERYQRRDELAGPNGSLTQELQSSRETLAPLDADCARFENLPSFSELIEIGYDTPSFKEKWWHASYWKHWAAGDRICKELEMGDFGDDVIPAYNKVAEPRNFMRGEVARLEREIDAIHEQVREHDQIADRLAHLEETYLVEAQDFLGEHLINADAALLEQWAQAEPDLLRAVQMGVRKLAGIAAKRNIIAEIANVGVPQTIAQLEMREQKARTKSIKYSRPKNTYMQFPDNAYDPSFNQKATGMQAQLDKLQRRVDSLVENQHYAAFDLRNDNQLWWLYFMNSMPPARYAPHLHEYYTRHPDINVVTDPDFADDVVEPEPGDAAARAFIATQERDNQEGYLS